MIIISIRYNDNKWTIYIYELLTKKNKKTQTNKRYTTNARNCANSKTKLTKLVHGKTKRLKHKQNGSVFSIEKYLAESCVTKEANKPHESGPCSTKNGNVFPIKNVKVVYKRGKQSSKS